MTEDKIGAEEEEQIDDSPGDEYGTDGLHEHNEERRKEKKRKTREEEPPGLSDGNELDGSRKGGFTAAEKLKHSLSKDNANVGQPLEDIAADISEEDEMADLNVDEHGAPARTKKPKKSRQQPGISSSALHEGHELSSDVGDLGRTDKLEVLHRKSKTTYMLDEDDYDLLDMFFQKSDTSVSRPEPKHMNRGHDAIWEVDIPERMQMFEEGTGHPPIDEIGIKTEADWIYNELFSGKVPFFNRTCATTEEVDDKLKRHIARFLELMHVQKLDVPFIAMYRKEEILSLLNDPSKSEADIENYHNQKHKLKWHEVLWTIQNLDQKWLLLQKTKSDIQSCYTKRFEDESRGIDNETCRRLNEQIFESIIELLKAADSEREVDDVDLKFNLHFSLGEVTKDERPKGVSYYWVCRKAGLLELASKFGKSSEQFGSQISQKKMGMYELEDAAETPEKTASNFKCAIFETTSSALKGARHMASVEISVEPCIRKHVRRIFMDNAVVSTSPTPRGNTVVDSFHQFFGVKCLKEKPLSKFEYAQWLLIQKAEEEKLLQVTIKLPEAVLDELISESNYYYLNVGVGKSAQLWNEQRKLILLDAFHNYLLPAMEKESILLLTSRAKTWVRREYGKILWDKVSISPEKWKVEDDVYIDITTAPRVMACCWGPGNPATTFVMLDSLGEVLGVQQGGSPRKFLMHHEPQVVILGAADLSCRQLMDEILKGISHMIKDNPRKIGCFYGDESLPRLYENSSISADQLPSHKGITRRAVALGRYYQYPLAMVATLCGSGREILSWKLNSFESFLSPGEKYGMVEQVMVDVTNQVGLDINLACHHQWLLAPLQFISGLGPKKAAALQRSLVGVGSFHYREDLRTRHGIGNNVFKNAVGFLPILCHMLRSYKNYLDDTRVHPESYSIAQDLAKSIFLKNGNAYKYIDDHILAELAIEHVRSKPHLLKAVDVDEYAEKNKLQNKKETLNDIIVELIEGYQDRRKPYAPLSEDDVFYMLCGESEESLFVGKIVKANVRKVPPKTGRVLCVLESGLSGELCEEDYSNNINEGDILTCRIQSIQKLQYLVILTTHKEPMTMDPYYHEDCHAYTTHNE